MDILRSTNFFKAFSASASVPAVYIQQFWNSMKYDEKTGVYSCQVDEQWFNLSVDLLRKALDITPVDPAHPFELPLTGDTVIDFVNQLGYPEPVEFVSNIRNVIGSVYSRIQTFFSHKMMKLNKNCSSREGDVPDLELAKKLSLDEHPEREKDPVSETTTKLPEVVGKGKAIVTENSSFILSDLVKGRKELRISLSLLGVIKQPHDSTTGTSSNCLGLPTVLLLLEQEMSEVKKTGHSADVLASIKSQVPTVVDKYLGTKLDDALLKILE
ncbi:hypothetical protein Tco_0862833 [Tanacetum coccineum]